jgi:hypothetical protein
MSVNIYVDTSSGRALEASRRVGWGKYFAEQERAEELLAICEQLYDLVRFHDRLPSGDPSLVRAQSLMDAARTL